MFVNLGWFNVFPSSQRSYGGCGCDFVNLGCFLGNFATLEEGIFRWSVFVHEWFLGGFVDIDYGWGIFDAIAGSDGSKDIFLWELYDRRWYTAAGGR